MLKVTGILLASIMIVYLVYSTYKFILLLGHHNKIQDIPDYESYSEKIVTKTSDKNQGFSEMENIHYLCANENIYFFVGYDNLKMDLGQRVIGQVIFINKNTNQYYSLKYDEKLQKFVEDGLFKDKNQEEINQILRECGYALDKSSVIWFLTSSVSLLLIYVSKFVEIAVFFSCLIFFKIISTLGSSFTISISGYALFVLNLYSCDIFVYFSITSGLTFFIYVNGERTK